MFKEGKIELMVKTKISSIAKYLLAVTLLVIFVPNSLLIAENKDANNPEDVFDMPLEQLMEIEVVSTATLTQTKPRLVPAAITTITKEEIRSSEARSLYELLDIYVPHLQWSRHHWENDVMGLRGIINDRNDKYLLLVNGRNMNQRTHYGALSEQDLVLLNDIHHIDIVRGPGSALYGPGAIAMVINIVTFNADTFQGTEVSTRLGAIEEFYTGEIKHGRRFDANDGGIFIYGGFGKYVGSNKHDSPQIFPFTFPTTGGSAPTGTIPGEGTQAGEPMTNTNLNRDGAAALGMMPAKMHIQIIKDNWDIWARFTRGGKEMTWAVGSIARSPYGWGTWAWNSKYAGARVSPPPVRPNFVAYMQLTGYIGYKQELNDKAEIDYAFSFSTTSISKERESRYGDYYREDNYYAKMLLKLQPNENHKVALGAEYSHLNLGLKPLGGLGYTPARTRGSTPVQIPNAQEWGYNVIMPTWSTDLWSLLGEWQWNINDRWTSFFSARLDDHQFTSKLFSPRAALVYTPNEKDTYKLMWTKSVRTNFEAEMKKEYETSKMLSDPEKLTSTEIRYERQQNKNLNLASSLFIHKLEVISWSSRSTNVGTQKDWGIEFEADYHTDKTRLILSHGYTKLISFTLAPGVSSYISAKPYKFGNDLTNWSNHNTKLVFQRKLNDKLTLDTSLRIYWGFPGLKDYERYQPWTSSSTARTVERGWQRTFRGSYFLDLGLQYKYSKNLEIGLTGYNLLGIFNPDFNKRNYIETGGAVGSDFRSHAPAVGLSLTYTF